jgi:hypothetical protein
MGHRSEEASATLTRSASSTFVFENCSLSENLSLAGRITLCKSVLMSVPLYPMQSILLPKSIFHEIEKICRRFIWADYEGSKKVHLIKWKKICQPRLEGG